MSTFIPGVTDTFPQQSLYTPDYEFLSQIYGTKQSQYDKGFAAVKNMYNSLLSKSVTNGENEEFRSKTFKQIEGRLRSVAGLDLSNNANVEKALTTFAPLTDDMELLHDMSVTASQQKEFALSERLRTSTKAEERKLYNPLSIEDMSNAVKELSNAKRGDGSILRTSSRKYVANENIQEYLTDLYTKEGLKNVIETRVGDGTIIKVTNGKDFVVPLTEWTLSKLSDPRFSDYFGMMGRVMTERKMKPYTDMGLSRTDARTMIASELKEQALTERGARGVLLEKELSSVQYALDQFEKKYPNKQVPVSEMEKLQDLFAKKEQYTSALATTKQEIEELSSDNLEPIANSLEGEFTKNLMLQTSSSWARQKSMLTQEIDISTDEALLKKWDLDYNYARLASDRELAFFKEEQENMRLDKRLLTDLELKKMDLTKERRATKRSASDPYTPDDPEYRGFRTGAYTPTQTLTGIDALNSMRESTLSHLYNTAFDNDGALFHIVGRDKHRVLYPTIDKINTIAQGNFGRITLTQQDQANIVSLASELGIPAILPKDKNSANVLLRSIIGGLYKTGSERIQSDKTNTSIINTQELNIKLGDLYAGMGADLERSYEIGSVMEGVSDYITDDNGVLTEGYADAKVLYYTPEGKAVYDVSKLSVAQKRELHSILPNEYKKSSVLVGSEYEFDKPQGYELGSMLSGNKASQVILNGRDITTAYNTGKSADVTTILKSLPQGESFAEAFGETIKVFYDPLNKSVIFNMRLDPSSSVVGALDETKKSVNTLQITMPYSTVAETPGLQRFATNIAANTPGWSKLGIASTLLEHPKAQFRLPNRLNAAKFNGSIAGQTYNNGSYGIALQGDFVDPVTYEVTKVNHVFPAEMGDPASLMNAELQIEHFLNGVRNKAASMQLQQESKNKGEQTVDTRNMKW